MADLCLSISRRIAAPQQRVWDVITDLEGCAERIEAIVKVEMLTGPSVGVGTRWKETRLLFKRETTETMEITAFEPPLRYLVEADSCGAHFASELRCEPDGGAATVLSMTMETTPRTWFAKLMKPLARLTMGTTRKMLERDLDDIAAACTGSGGAVDSLPVRQDASEH
ncbi:MAG: SRPBCC family protein [Phycisphaerales bacterium]|jgi:carbon monoxide dehydrogenase subunit G|nr:SRPBCC family protein [Phycisphaerales bacterium]